MTTLNDLIFEVQQTLNGYGLAQPRAAFLSSSVTASALTLPVTNAANFSQGVAEIEDETVFIESVDTTANTLTVAPDGRGYYGTTAASHAANTRVESGATWPRNRIKAAINDVIVNTYPTLFGVATTTFTYNPAVTTYALPADAEQVLSVTADTVGPSNEQQRITRYVFNSLAPAEFPTGNTITLGEPATPGRLVTVTYAKQPSALATSATLFTASGLRATAKPLVILGTCSQLLAYMDAARLPVDTARADEYDERNAVGSASRISVQLLQRYEMELEKERKRLRAASPVPINLRIR